MQTVPYDGGAVHRPTTENQPPEPSNHDSSYRDGLSRGEYVSHCLTRIAQLAKLAEIAQTTEEKSNWFSSIRELKKSVRAAMQDLGSEPHQATTRIVPRRVRATLARRSPRAPRRAIRSSSAPPGDDGGSEPPGDPDSRSPASRSEVGYVG